MNKFADGEANDVRDSLLENLDLGYVDIKFQPILDKKLNNRLSDFDPQNSIKTIDDNIVDKYLEEQKSSIPTNVLKEGLDKITRYGDKDS